MGDQRKGSAGGICGSFSTTPSRSTVWFSWWTEGRAKTGLERPGSVTYAVNTTRFQSQPYTVVWVWMSLVFERFHRNEVAVLMFCWSNESNLARSFPSAFLLAGLMWPKGTCTCSWMRHEWPEGRMLQDRGPINSPKNVIVRPQDSMWTARIIADSEKASNPIIQFWFASTTDEVWWSRDGKDHWWAMRRSADMLTCAFSIL